MSIEAMNWALAQQTGSAAAKSVLLILSNRADHRGICWPGITGISEQTELSRRAVIDNLKILESRGFMRVLHRPKPATNVYLLNVQGSAADALVQELHGAADALDGAADALPMVQELHLDSAGAAPKPKGTISKPTRTVSRATRLPDDFELTDERRLVAEAETLPADRTFAKFRDYWMAASGAKARKHDWDATWRNWCRSEADRSRGNSRPQKLSYAEQLKVDMKSKGMM